MKAKDLSEKLGLIDNDLIEEASTAGAAVKRRRPAKKIGVSILVAVLLLTASFSIALAVNEDFRLSVIAFFKLGTVENVPPGTTTKGLGGIELVSSAEMDGLINIDYLKIHGSYEYGNGVIFSYNEAEGYAGGAYYRVEKGKITPLETRRAEASFACRGYNWSVRFDYALVDGQLYIHNMPDERMTETGEDDALFAYASPMKDGSIERVLLTLPFPHSNLRSYSEYAVVMDIATGKVTDFLGTCGLDSLRELVHEISFSEDLSKAVITCFDSGYNGEISLYYCDIKNQRLLPLSQITGEPVSQGWLLDSEMLFYTTENFDGWRMNLTTGEKTQVYAGLKAYRDAEGGVQFLGGRYALLVNADRRAWLMDLRTGSQTFIDGLSFTTLTGTSINEEQTKIYFICYSEENLEVGQVGMLDIPRAQMVMLDREGQEIRREWDVDWFDNNRIAVNALEENKTRYLYLYEFKNEGLSETEQ